MKTFLRSIVAFASLLVISCGDVEPTIYNSDAASSETFLSFSATTYTLPVIIDEEGTLTVTLNSSTVSTIDRVYNLAILEEETTANPESYVFPSQVTIPAGSYQGTFEIKGYDVDVDIVAKPLVFEISNITTESMDNNKITVNVVQVCPLEDAFTGQYTVTVDSGINLNGTPRPIFANGSIVELKRGNSDFQRVFTAAPYPNLFAIPAINFTFDLVCGETYLAQDYEMPFSCSDAAFMLTKGGFASTYNPEDDTVIQITVTEDAESACGGPYQRTITLTKVD